MSLIKFNLTKYPFLCIESSYIQEFDTNAVLLPNTYTYVDLYYLEKGEFNKDNFEKCIHLCAFLCIDLHYIWNYVDFEPPKPSDHDITTYKIPTFFWEFDDTIAWPNIFNIYFMKQYCKTHNNKALLLDAVVKHGRDDIYEYLRDKTPVHVDNYIIVNALVKHDSYKFFDIIMHNNAYVRNDIVMKCIEYDNLTMLKYCREKHNPTITEHHLTKSIEYCSVNCYKYIKSFVNLIFGYSSDLLSYPIKNQDIEMLNELINEGYEVNNDDIIKAICYESHEIINILYDNYEGIFEYEDVMLVSIKYNHIDFIRKIQSEVRNNPSYIATAITYNNYEMLLFLHGELAYSIPEHAIMLCTKYGGNADILKYIHHQGYDITQGHINNAFKNGFHEQIKYMISYGIPMPKKLTVTSKTTVETIELVDYKNSIHTVTTAFMCNNENVINYMFENGNFVTNEMTIPHANIKHVSKLIKMDAPVTVVTLRACVNKPHAKVFESRKIIKSFTPSIERAIKKSDINEFLTTLNTTSMSYSEIFQLLNESSNICPIFKNVARNELKLRMMR
jgi:hypothetical protein